MKRFVLLVAVVFAVVFGFVLAWRLVEIILMFLASLALAATLRAPIDRLMERRIRRPVAIVVTYLLAALFAVGLLVLLYQKLGSELALLSEDLSYVYSRLVILFQAPTQNGASAAPRFPTPEQMTALLSRGQVSNLVSRLLPATQGLAGSLGNLGLVLILSLYWTADHLRFERLALSLMPVAKRGTARRIWRAIENGTGRYLRSEILQSLIAGIILAPAFALLGVNWPVFWALAASVAWFVPLVGAFIVIVPMWVIVWVESGPLVATLAVAAVLLVLAFLEFVLEPRLNPRERGTNVLTIVVVLIMADAYGLLGLMLAPPIAAAIHILLLELANPILAAPALAGAAAELPAGAPAGVATGGAVASTPIADRPPVTAEMDELRARLESVRSLIGTDENRSDLRLQSMADRLEGILEEARQMEG